MKKGKVFLVGAGPSAPELFTIKGKKLIEQADVVVYDKLVGQGILSLVPHSTQKINVGKISGHHLVAQEQINKILLELALEGKNVVRLKGGDPFMFGRGGEELELLVENDIPFEIVSGITSPIAVPAFAGIPVTHRDFCSSLHIITAHKKRGSNEKLNFQSLVNLDGTLVFLMGVGSLDYIANGLIEAGMSKDMPCAIVERGTSAYQQSVVSTLENIYEDSKKGGIKPPATIIVGKVCSLAEKFAWSQKRELGGVRVIVTRPKDKASSLASKLSDLGAEVVEIPAIKTDAIEDNTLFDTALGNICMYDYLMFTSPVGVKVFFDKLKQDKIDLRNFTNLKFVAIGYGTKNAIEEHGIYCDNRLDYSSLHCGKDLAEALTKIVLPNQRVLILRAKETSNDIDEVFTNAGIGFEDIPTYKTSYVKHEDLLLDGGLDERDCIAFTSASTVKGFVASMGDIDFTKVKAYCIGKHTSDEARKYGMKIYTAIKPTIDELINCIIVNEKG